MDYPFKRLFLICTGERCNAPERGEQGGLAIREELKAVNKSLGRKRTVRVCSVSCLDMCEQGPNMVVEPGHVLHSGLNRQSARAVYDEEMETMKDEA